MSQFKIVKSAIRTALSFGYFNCVIDCVAQYIGNIIICIGSSMEPTIYSSDVLIIERIGNYKKRINKGDIVVSRSPRNPLKYICKRVTGVPGDKIHNGPFFKSVPKGHFWLEGDNKNSSFDSRDYGATPQGLIRGRVLFVIWPFNYKKVTKNIL